MWRYVAGGLAALAMAAAGIFLFQSKAAPEALPSPPPMTQADNGSDAAEALPPLERIPRATDRTREQKRFDRYDRDRSEAITLAELMEPRRKAFAKLDRDKDGKLSFEEWAIRTSTRFSDADKDKSGRLTRAEFATTAPKPRATPRTPKCDCREAVAQALAEAE
jgi:hypothetical protein